MPRLLKAEGWNFRNYKNFSLFPEEFNVFYGPNGQGKTSLLEALFVGLRGKSFRPYTSLDFIQSKQNQTSVHLKIKEEKGESRVISAFQKDKKAGEFSYCGKKVGRVFLEKQFPILIFTVEKIDVIKKDAGERRNLVDEMLFFQGKKSVLQRYSASLRQKNALLSAFQRGDYSLNEARNLLSALNETFFQSAWELMKERLALLNALFQDIKTVSDTLFSSLKPCLEFQYNVLETPVDTVEKGGSLLREDLNKKMERELRAGRSLTGPHRQDIKFLFNGQNSRVFCSQGQQRLFILSLLARQISPLNPPFLFLDDVLSELDDKAQCQLLSFLEETKAQVFLTGCKKVPWTTKKMSFFSIKNGTINPL